MTHHTINMPLSVIDDKDDGSGEIEISFDYAPGSPPSGMTGPPEHYDPGSGEEFYVVDGGRRLTSAQNDAVVDWLEENWDRPDCEADLADYRYEQQRDERCDR